MNSEFCDSHWPTNPSCCFTTAAVARQCGTLCKANIPHCAPDSKAVRRERPPVRHSCSIMCPDWPFLLRDSERNGFHSIFGMIVSHHLLVTRISKAALRAVYVFESGKGSFPFSNGKKTMREAKLFHLQLPTKYRAQTLRE